MNIWVKVCVSALAVLSGGCGGEKVAGKLELVEDDSAILRIVVPSHSYPSRWLFFRPKRYGKDGVGAYQEPIYESRISTVFSNIGSDPFIVIYKSEEQEVAPGAEVRLPKIKFKDFRLRVVPSEGQQANVELRFKFDAAYTTDSWKVIAAWSDGP